MNQLAKRLPSLGSATLSLLLCASVGACSIAIGELPSEGGSAQGGSAQGGSTAGVSGNGAAGGSESSGGSAAGSGGSTTAGSGGSAGLSAGGSGGSAGLNAGGASGSSGSGGAQNSECIEDCDCDGDGAKAIECGGDDCDDYNPNVSPKETRYFSTPSSNEEVGFDYNCNEQIERNPNLNKAVDCGGITDLLLCFGEGFQTSAPACGERKAWGKCESNGLLQCAFTKVSDRTMTCR